MAEADAPASLIGTVLVENRLAASLKPDPDNPRRHSPEHVDLIDRLICEFGFTNPILADEHIRGGHGRQLAVLQIYSRGETIRLPNGEELPPGTVPVIDCTGWSAEQRRAYLIADNQSTISGDWDEAKMRAQIEALTAAEFDLGLLGFDDEELARLRAAGDDPGEEQRRRLGSLTDEFMIAPFSVLNAREGWWQDRKRAWLSLGIESELGRGENLLKMSETILEPDPAKRAALRKAAAHGAGTGGHAGGGTQLVDYRARNAARAAAEALGEPFDESAWDGGRRKLGAVAIGGADWIAAKKEAGDIGGNMNAEKIRGSGTSIFDPVLCELAYRWFSPPEGLILDPFAGGSVRGIVAGALGRSYLGVDLRLEQCEANLEQWGRIGARVGGIEPKWLCGDSESALPGLDHEFAADFLFSCPPYGDLEVYSDDPRDLSNLDPEAFDAAYARIIALAVERLKPDRFACFVVGDYRDKRGIYRDFVSKTIAAFRSAGAGLYNEIVLVTAAGSLAIRAGKQFRTTRKVGKTHQNVLVFAKGDPRKATEACGPVDVEASMALFEGDIDEGQARDEREARVAVEADSQPGTIKSEATKYGERITSIGGEV